MKEEQIIEGLNERIELLKMKSQGEKITYLLGANYMVARFKSTHCPLYKAITKEIDKLIGRLKP